MEMKSSIALTTYNGIKWLPELLDSIVNQIVPADEVVIFDDASTDGTFEYVENYIHENGLINWRIYRNKINLGWRKNFRNSLFKCSGDIIFLCDQDDIWKPEKIKEMKELMYKNSDIGVLVSNYEPLYDDKYNSNKIKVKSLNENNNLLEKIELQSSSICPMRPGCTYCVRREMIQIFNEKDLEHRAHDCVLWNYAIITDKLYIYNKSLIKFRRHYMSASRPKEKLSIRRRLSEIKLDIEMILFNIEILNNKDYKENNNIKILKESLKFSEERYLVLKSKSIIKLILFQLINYNMYATRRNQLSDIYLLLFARRDFKSDESY